jgi:DUF177 domain-containing protein
VLITPQELELHRMEVKEAYAPGVLDYDNAEFKQTGPLKLEAVAELVGKDIRVKGRLATELERACDRCLSPVKFPLERDFDLLYAPMQTIAKTEEIEIPEDELDIGFYTNDGIETSDIATEQVILAVPMKTVCQEECRGLCPICGKNRNLEDCHCEVTRRDSPFASLLEE